MIRKQIYLEQWQVEVLQSLARERGVTQSQIVREIMNRELDQSGSVISKPVVVGRATLSMKSGSADGSSPDWRSRHAEPRRRRSNSNFTSVAF
jgi:hypothetical protein